MTSQTMEPPEDLGFPSEYLNPLMTEKGPTYPPPKVRLLLDDVENIQKRSVIEQQRGHPDRLRKAYPNKEERELAYNKAKKAYGKLQAELETVLRTLSNVPFTKEQLIAPRDLIMKYITSGPLVERHIAEDWAGQYKIEMDRRAIAAERESEEMDDDVVDDAEDDPAPGTFLRI